MEKIAVSKSKITAIADIIRSKTGTTDLLSLDSMPTMIGSITGGGGGSTGGGGSADPLDPVSYYNATRPTDWLKMPSDDAINDNELYLLIRMMPKGIAQNVWNLTVSGGSPIVQFGTTDSNGVWTAKAGLASVSSGTFNVYGSDFADQTPCSDGMVQCMVKISCTAGYISYFACNGNKNCLFEFKGKASSITTLKVGNSAIVSSSISLRYFALLGAHSVTNMNYMFYNCYSLQAIPQLDTSSATSMVSMFQNCYSLQAIPQLDTSSVTNMSNMFYNCYSLQAIPQLDTSSVTNMNSMFQYCYNLQSIPQLDTSSATSMSYMFYNCLNLQKVLLTPTVTGWAGQNIDLKNCNLSHDAIVDLLNSLPTITENKTLTLTGNIGVSTLTDAEKAIATGKNWTLTL